MDRMQYIKDIDPELFDTWVSLISKLDKEIKDLESNTLRNFSVYMQKNWVWIGGILTMFGTSMLTVYTLFLK